MQSIGYGEHARCACDDAVMRLGDTGAEMRIVLPSEVKMQDQFDVTPPDDLVATLKTPTHAAGSTKLSCKFFRIC